MIRQLYGRELPGHFYLFKMKDFDAILGLDWLEEHYALIDCRRKRVIFRLPGEKEFSHPLPKIGSEKLVVSAMKVAKLLC